MFKHQIQNYQLIMFKHQIQTTSSSCLNIRFKATSSSYLNIRFKTTSSSCFKIRFKTTSSSCLNIRFKTTSSTSLNIRFKTTSSSWLNCGGSECRLPYQPFCPQTRSIQTVLPSTYSYFSLLFLSFINKYILGSRLQYLIKLLASKHQIQNHQLIMFKHQISMTK